MKLWVDDVRPAPEGYKHIKSVHDAMYAILWTETAYWENETIELIDLDHDAGDYTNDGGDYIEILNWLEERFIDITRRQRNPSINSIHQFHYLFFPLRVTVQSTQSRTTDDRSIVTIEAIE